MSAVDRPGRDAVSSPATVEAAAAAPAGEDWRAGVRKSGSKQLVVLALTALLVLVGAWAVGRHTGAGQEPANAMAQAVQLRGEQSGPAPQVGTVPQDFTATTVTGERITLSALKGRPVWLTFGASWCTACRAEAPDLQALYTAHKGDGLQIVSVDMQEMPADITAYVNRVGITFPQIADPQTALASRYRVMGLPSHFVIGRDGVLRATHVGAMTRPAMEAALAKAK